MFIDPQSATSGGGAALALILYAAGSMFVTGPLVVARSVEKSGWVARCERSVQDEIRSRASTQVTPPTMNCDVILGSMDPRVRELMGKFGADAACKAMDLKRQQDELAQQAQARLVQSALEQSGSRCACAVSHLAENKRVAIGLYAGTARLITPAAIRNLNAHLKAALHAPACKLLTEVSE